MSTALVTTTIFVPRNLAGYFQNFAANGHRDVFTIVIGDRKTPAEVGPFLADLERSTGYEIDYWDVERQRAWLEDLPELAQALPWNSVQRRNLGYLLAAMKGAERIISIDDDNFVTDDDYLGFHGIVGESATLPAVSTPGGWFNSGSLLETEPEKPLYHRGFPVDRRDGDATPHYQEVSGRVVVNAGLWLETPDADAMSHVDCPVRVTGFRRGAPERLLVAHGTGTVFNSQNTCLHRDLLPVIFLPVMGERAGELVVGRYDDIWMSLFVKRLADHLGDYVCVGRPFSRQVRNDHDLLSDMLVEIPAQRMTPRILRSLDAVELEAGDYAGCYDELVAGLRRRLSADGYSSGEASFLRRMLDRMAVWAKACRATAGAGYPTVGAAS
jgi:hypothetical protein